MGSLSAMSSIKRVLETHGEEMMQEWLEQAPEGLREQLESVELENAVHAVEVYWKFKGGATLQGPRIGIDELAERYPDCEVGY